MVTWSQVTGVTSDLAVTSLGLNRIYTGHKRDQRSMRVRLRKLGVGICICQTHERKNLDGRAVDHNTPKFELSVQWCKRAGAFGRKTRESKRKYTPFIAQKILKQLIRW